VSLERGSGRVKAFGLRPTEQNLEGNLKMGTFPKALERLKMAIVTRASLKNDHITLMKAQKYYLMGTAFKAAL